MADYLSDLSLVNSEVQKAGLDEKRSRNNAIRKGLENPGLYQSTFGTSTDTTSGTQPIQQVSQQPQYQSDIDNWSAPTSWTTSDSNLYLDPKYAGTRAINKPTIPYSDINKISQQYYNAGFRPGNQVSGWNYKPDILGGIGGKGGTQSSPGSASWTRTSPNNNKTYQSIMYNPSKGYSSRQVTDVGNEGDWDSVGLVASIIGGMVLPGLGTSWSGLANNAAQNLGLTSGNSLGGLFGSGGIYGTGLNLGSSFLNNAIEKGISSTITSGGDLKKGLISGLASGTSSGLGGLFDNDIGKYVSSMSQPAISSALSGGTLQDVVKNSLFGGASAGLGSLLNSTDLMSGNTQEKNALANNAVGLAQTLSRKRKVA